MALRPDWAASTGAEAGQVPLGVVLADVQLQVGHPAGVVLVERERGWPERVADLPDGPLDGVRDGRPYPQVQDLPGVAVGLGRR